MFKNGDGTKENQTLRRGDEKPLVDRIHPVTGQPTRLTSIKVSSLLDTIPADERHLYGVVNGSVRRKTPESLKGFGRKRTRRGVASRGWALRTRYSRPKTSQEGEQEKNHSN